MFVAENDSVANNSNDIRIINDNSYLPLLHKNKQFHVSVTAQKFSIPSSSGISIENVETEEQGKINIDNLILYLKWNKCNTKIFYSADEYIDEEYLIEPNNKEKNNEENEDTFKSNNEVVQGGQQIPNQHNAAVCCSKYQKLFNTYTYIHICGLFYYFIIFPDNCRKERKRYEKLIMRKMNELLEIVRANHDPIERRHCYPLFPLMPFNNINALKQFDRDLNENEEMRNQFVRMKIF